MIHFRVYKTGLLRKRWRFRIVGLSNKTLATSGSYASLAEVEATIKLIRNRAAVAVVRSDDV